MISRRRNRKPTPCPKCGRPIEYYGALGEYWCGSAGCQTRLSAPRVSQAPDNGDGDGDGPQSPQEGREGRGRRQPAPDAEEVPVVVRLADVSREEVNWEWEARLPRRRIVLVEGDPGVGKSWLALAIAAAITTGAPLPGQTAPREPGNVLLLTAEDGLGDTIRPRLEDMGADLSRVAIIPAMRDERGNERHLSLVKDLGAVEAVLGEGGFKLLVIDPLNAYLGFALDTHRDAALRAVLTPLALLAERWGVIVLCIRHLTKSARDKAIYRGQGSIAYTAAARVVFLVGVNPDDQQERVMVCLKNNLAPLPVALAFELSEGQFLWRGETSISAAALLMPDGDDGERSALAEAQEFLRDLLADGPVEAEEGWRQARKLGLKDRTLGSARAALRVKAHREGFGPGGRWVWELPGIDRQHDHRLQSSLYKENLQPMESPDTKLGQEAETFAASGEPAPTVPRDTPADLGAGAGDDDAISPEFTGKRHYVVALGLELDFPNVCWPGGGIPAGRYYYLQAAHFFSDADIEKAVTALEATAAGRRGSDA